MNIFVSGISYFCSMTEAKAYGALIWKLSFGEFSKAVVLNLSYMAPVGATGNVFQNREAPKFSYYMSSLSTRLILGFNYFILE